MAEPSREWKQSAEDLRYLLELYERAECQAEDRNDSNSELDAVKELDVEDRPWSEAVRPK